MNTNNNNTSNYNVPFNYAREKLAHLNPQDISSLGNVEFDQTSNHFIVNLLGNIYYVKYPNGEILTSDGNVSDNLDINIIIIRYIINATGVPFTNKFITFKEVPGGNVYYPNFLSRTIKKLSTKFTSSIDQYKVVMNMLGAEPLKMGDLAYKFKFLGNTSLIFILWFGDDEFEPNANILFDSNIIYYFNAEDLAVVPDIAINLINEKIKSLNK